MGSMAEGTSEARQTEEAAQLMHTPNIGHLCAIEANIGIHCSCGWSPSDLVLCKHAQTMWPCMTVPQESSRSRSFHLP